MSTDSQLLLTAWYERRDYEARRQLIEAHLPLVRALASRFVRDGEQLEDLVQVGSVGLIKAVDRYDPRRGSSLTAYAVPTIVGEIRRHLRDGTQPLRVPRAQRGISTVERCRWTTRQTSSGMRRPNAGSSSVRSACCSKRGCGPREARAAHRSAALLRRPEPAADRRGARTLAGTRLASPARVVGQATRRNRPNIGRDITLRVLCG